MKNMVSGKNKRDTEFSYDTSPDSGSCLYPPAERLKHRPQRSPVYRQVNTENFDDLPEKRK